MTQSSDRWSGLRGRWHAFVHWWTQPGPASAIYRQLRWHFDGDLENLEMHEKRFPGYDVASLHRAMTSFFEDCCEFSREIGPTNCATIEYFLVQCKANSYMANLKPAPPNYQRVPVDVDEEESLPTNNLTFATLCPDALALEGGLASGEEKVAVLLNVAADYDAWDGMDTDHVPRQQVNLSIACRTRALADRFFAEIEERRKRLCVFRGKVIDPVLHNSMITTLGFRAVREVGEEDLILPEKIKGLLQSCVVGFYSHREVLQKLGVDLKRGILLHGPPGTGKTSIALYLSGQLPNFTVCFVSGERLLYPREICRMARYLQPAMVVFEDIDLVAQARDANGLATVLGELMNQIDGCDPADQVLFLMTTNSLKRLESAVRNRPGRVDQIVEIPLPDAPTRERLLRLFARGVDLDCDNLDRVVEATDGVTPAMLKEVVKRGTVHAIDRNGQSGAGILVTEGDLLLAVEQVRALRETLQQIGRVGFGAK